MKANDNKTQEEKDENEHGRKMKKLKRGCVKVFWKMCGHELNLINHLPTLEAVLKGMS